MKNIEKEIIKLGKSFLCSLHPSAPYKYNGKFWITQNDNPVFSGGYESSAFLMYKDTDSNAREICVTIKHGKNSVEALNNLYKHIVSYLKEERTQTKRSIKKQQKLVMMIDKVLSK